jgi:antitoxin component of RelBE/YafQ-DinJ toxin-antitoxin module
MSKEVVVNIRMDKDDKKKLEALAELSNRNISDYVRLLIKQAITDKTKV